MYRYAVGYSDSVDMVVPWVQRIVDQRNEATSSTYGVHRPSSAPGRSLLLFCNLESAANIDTRKIVIHLIGIEAAY